GPGHREQLINFTDFGEPITDQTFYLPAVGGLQPFDLLEAEFEFSDELHHQDRTTGEDRNSQVPDGRLAGQIRQWIDQRADGQREEYFLNDPGDLPATSRAVSLPH